MYRAPNRLTRDNKRRDEGSLVGLAQLAHHSFIHSFNITSIKMSKEDAPTNPPPPKKDRIISKPVPPSNVTTAYLILRGAIAGVVGAPIGDGDSISSLMQPSYIKDKYPSGKFSIGLGKKQGTACHLDVPEETKGQQQLLDAIEEAANRIV